MNQHYCFTCQKHYASYASLFIHKTLNKHKNALKGIFKTQIPDNNICKICDKTFKDKYGYRLHLNSNRHKLISEGLYCSFCNMTFNNKSKLAVHCNSNRHLKTLAGESKAKHHCKLCNVSVRYKKQHEKSKLHTDSVNGIIPIVRTKYCKKCDWESTTYAAHKTHLLTQYHRYF